MLLDFAKNSYRRARNYFNLRGPKDIVLINDAGIFYISIYGKIASVPLHISHYEYNGIKEGLTAFSGKLLKSRCYFGRPITILLGGSQVFHEISIKASNSSGSRDFIYKVIDSNNYDLAYRSIKIGQETIMAFHSGIRPEAKIAIYNTFIDAGIPVLDCMPVAYYIIKSYSGDLSQGTHVFMLPGLIVWIGMQKKAHIYEQPCDYPDTSGFVPDDIAARICHDNPDVKYYSLFEGNQSEKNQIGTVSLSFPLNRAHYRGTKSFWGQIPGENTTRLLNTLERSLRTAALLVTAISIILAVAWLLLSFWSGLFDKKIAQDDSLQTEVITLESEVSRLENQIKASGYSLPSSDFLATSISAFCQKKPAGLYLDKIDYRKDKDGVATFTAFGFAANEDEIFLYKGHIESYGKEFKVDIKNMERLQPRGGAETSTQPRYAFAMTLAR